MLPAGSEDSINLNTLRTFRVLRPLKLVSGVPSKSWHIFYTMAFSLEQMSYSVEMQWFSVISIFIWCQKIKSIRPLVTRGSESWQESLWFSILLLCENDLLESKERQRPLLSLSSFLLRFASGDELHRKSHRSVSQHCLALTLRCHYICHYRFGILRRCSQPNLLQSRRPR